MGAQAAGKKAKKGFMTPERKKKQRLLKNWKRSKRGRLPRGGKSLTSDVVSPRILITPPKMTLLQYARSITQKYSNSRVTSGTLREELKFDYWRLMSSTLP